MAYTEAQKNASIKYMKEKTDDIRIRAPKGTKERWADAAAAEGISTTQLVIKAVDQYLKALD